MQVPIPSIRFLFVCQVSFCFSFYNASDSPSKSKNCTDFVSLQQEFSKKYRDDIRKFGMMQRYDDSLQYLQEHPYLVCEETANYLVIWCIDLEVEEVGFANNCFLLRFK